MHFEQTRKALAIGIREQQGSAGLDHRSKIYAHYASIALPHWHVAPEEQYRVWSDATRRRLQDWLPKHRDVVCVGLGYGGGNMLYLLRASGYSGITSVSSCGDWQKLAVGFGAALIQPDAIEYLTDKPGRVDFIPAFDLIEHLTNLRGVLAAWNIAERSHSGSGIYTRVFPVRAQKNTVI